MSEILLSARRAAGLLGLCAAALSAPGTLHAAPPVRNLSVEIRIVDGGVQAAWRAGAAAAVSVDSAGRSSSTGAVVLQSGARHEGGDTLQRVQVLNGARASLQLAQDVPVQDTEVVWTPWGAGAAVRSRWVELVNGVQVWPRWPGGDSPVTLDIAVQRAAPLAAGTAAQGSSQTLLLSTLQLPLDEWVDVARLQQRQAGIRPQPNGFSASSAAHGRSLQVRVSLP